MIADWRTETKQCPRCGRGFQSRTANQRYCGRLCRQRAERARGRSQRQQDRRDPPLDEKPDE